MRLIVGGHDPSGTVVFDRRRALEVAPGAAESASLLARSVEEPLLFREQVFPFTIHVQPDKLAARQITGELLMPSRFLFGCLLLVTIALLALLLLLGSVWLGLIPASIPGLVANGDLKCLQEQPIRMRWQEEWEITGFAGAEEACLVITGKTASPVQLTWPARASVSYESVWQSADAGWTITALAFGHERWWRDISEEEALTSQRWR